MDKSLFLVLNKKYFEEVKPQENVQIIYVNKLGSQVIFIFINILKFQKPGIWQTMFSKVRY